MYEAMKHTMKGALDMTEPWMLITKELLGITRIYFSYFKLGSKPLY